MSSGTSTSSAPRVRLKRDTADDALQPWQLFTLAGLVGATIVVFLSRGQTPAAVILLSVTIFTAAGMGVAAWRTLAPIAEEDESSNVPVLGGRNKAALEREKTLVLRSIKELEFDRAMGKVSDKDFDEMGARLRGRAGRLIRQLDAGAGYRQLIDQDLQRRTGRAPQAVTSPAVGPQPVAQRVPHPVPPAAAVTNQTCASCSTINETDAVFCKRCGAKLGAGQ